MKSSEGKTQRRFWPPRFSVRTLAILITLFCAYLACWIPTKRAAAKIGSPNSPPVVQSFTNKGMAMFLVPHAEAPAPLILSQLEWEPRDNTPPIQMERRCYLWFFGITARLPIAMDYKPPSIVADMTEEERRAINEVRKGGTRYAIPRDPLKVGDG